MQTMSGPATKTYSNRRLHTITKGYDDIEIVMLYLMSLSFALNSSMLSGCSEFPNYHIFV